MKFDIFQRNNEWTDYRAYDTEIGVNLHLVLQLSIPSPNEAATGAQPYCTAFIDDEAGDVILGDQEGLGVTPNEAAHILILAEEPLRKYAYQRLGVMDKLCAGLGEGQIRALAIEAKHQFDQNKL
jgi:hypothetical protein